MTYFLQAQDKSYSSAKLLLYPARKRTKKSQSNIRTKEQWPVFPPFVIVFPSHCLSAGCRAGTFGPNCKSRCSCLNGGRCDFRTGACYCPPGFIGADCSSSESGRLASVCFFKTFFEVILSGLLVISSSLFFLENCERPQLRQPKKGPWKKDIHLLLFVFVFILLCEGRCVYFRRLSEWILREGLR